jgi:hypothetical protein
MNIDNIYQDIHVYSVFILDEMSLSTWLMSYGAQIPIQGKKH